MLNQYIQSESMLYADEVEGWQQAVDMVAEPLLASGDIEAGYVDAIKASISAPGGTYIDLGGGIALAHSRPENGVVRTSLSVLHVGKPFLLADSEEHPIHTMFCLAAQDSNTHLELMQALAGLLTDEARRNELAQAKSLTEVKSIFAD